MNHADFESLFEWAKRADAKNAGAWEEIRRLSVEEAARQYFLKQSEQRHGGAISSTVPGWSNLCSSVGSPEQTRCKDAEKYQNAASVTAEQQLEQSPAYRISKGMVV